MGMKDHNHLLQKEKERDLGKEMIEEMLEMIEEMIREVGTLMSVEIDQGIDTEEEVVRKVIDSVTSGGES